MGMTAMLYRWVPLSMILILMTVIMVACHKSYDDWMNN
jgi:hypothetical protein